ncbi:hypothetical protein [Lysobacter humi (ex Lee et al. 2017)]
MPTAAVATGVVREKYSDRLDDVAYGQKSIIWAILLYLAAPLLGALWFFLLIAAILISIGLGWSGIYKITRGLRYPLWARLLCLAAMLVPLVSLLALLFLNNRATARLKQAGFSVGLLGARRY